MRKVFTLSLVLVGITLLYAKELNVSDASGLAAQLQLANYEKVYTGSAKLLNAKIDIDSAKRAELIYMNIFAAAGMVTQGKMNYKALAKSVSGFIGKKITTTPFPLTASDEEGSINKGYYTEFNQRPNLFTTASNPSNTNVICFISADLHESPDPSVFSAKPMKYSGILKRIDYNPNESRVWVLRLTLQDAVLLPDENYQTFSAGEQ